MKLCFLFEKPATPGRKYPRDARLKGGLTPRKLYNNLAKMFEQKRQSLVKQVSYGVCGPLNQKMAAQAE
jgi:hypothetical protein